MVATPLFKAIAGTVMTCMFFAIFTVPIGMFNTKLFYGANGSKCAGLELVKAYIPFWNVRYARIISYGQSPVYLVALIMMTVLIVIRLVSVAIVTLVPVMLIFTPWCAIGAFAIWWVLAAINGIQFSSLLGAGGLTMLACVVLPPLGYYMLSNIVLPYFKAGESDVET